MTRVRTWRLTGAIGVAVLISTTGSVAAQPRSAAETRPVRPAKISLPLGPDDLAETRTSQRLQAGVTLTTIVRGSVDPTNVWTVEIAIAASATPDPDTPPTALSDRARADAQADRLRSSGYDPRVESVDTPATADYAGGRLGWRVRIGRLATKLEADTLLAQVRSAGYTASTRFTGWDGAPTDRGPWRVRVLTIDPERFDGRLLATFGPDLEDRETTSALSQAAGATAAVNGGYFVLDPASGAPGDPAGVGVYRGQLLSETVAERPALVLNADAEDTRVQRLHWTGTLQGRQGRHLALDGINRVPGLIRNCGGSADDLPTAMARHDFTCTDDDEVVAYTPQFGSQTPTGAGLEAVVNRNHRVVSWRSPRGGPLLAGQLSVQATGSSVQQLRRTARIGSTLTLTTKLVNPQGERVRTRRSTSIVNGGPVLVRRGQVHVTPARDGFVRPENPSFYYGFSSSRNPRTFAGVDGSGRTVLATADGRSTTSLGLSITETGAVAKALGMRSGLNLDGGGSTTMVVDGRVTNQPSDATGERPVGDALLILGRPH